MGDGPGEGTYFAVFARDADSLEDLRVSLHVAHCEYMRSLPCPVYEAGYFLHDHLQSAAGTMYLISSPAREDAIAVVSGEPFQEGGLFKELYVNEWRRIEERGFDSYATTPPYLVYQLFRQDAGAVSQQKRDAHAEWLRTASGRMLMAGELINPDPLASMEGPEVVGSMMLVCGESLEAVRAWTEADPYQTAGLYDEVICAPWTSLDVTNRALPNLPGPPIETWWTEEERAAAPDLFGTKEDLDRSGGKFTDDGALKSPEQELTDALSEEDTMEINAWGDAVERLRLGARPTLA